MIVRPLVIFIGYDPREDDAYHVCRASLLRHSSIPLHIVRLDQTPLRRSGWYRREWRQEGDNRIDQGDMKPFSTDFSFTRFLVPALSLYQGWALYCDCDFLFTADIAELAALADPAYAAMMVKHDHDPTEQTKMGGLIQSRYRRKNWSSLVMWNCGHPANAELTGYLVNEWSGQWLHAFSWLKDAQIGDLPDDWNWLAGVTPPLAAATPHTSPLAAATPRGIHYTLGTPAMPGCADVPYADLWRAARSLATTTEKE